jgi:hypothetical protein
MFGSVTEDVTISVVSDCCELVGITGLAKPGTAENHPERLFAAGIVSGAYRQYNGHPAARLPKSSQSN